MILACVLAADVVSSDVPVSVPHSAINAVPDSLATSKTRSLRPSAKAYAHHRSWNNDPVDNSNDLLDVDLGLNLLSNRGGRNF